MLVGMESLIRNAHKKMHMKYKKLVHEWKAFSSGTSSTDISALKNTYKVVNVYLG